jgi:hypothetical protein
MAVLGFLPPLIYFDVERMMDNPALMRFPLLQSSAARIRAVIPVFPFQTCVGELGIL